MTRTVRGLHLRLVMAVASSLSVVQGCASDEEPVVAEEPKLLRSPRALIDDNPDPDVVEVRLVAAPGHAQYLPDGEATIWGYRDGNIPKSKPSVPGPLLDVQQGQTVVVHFTNELQESTTIHWHGLRVPNASDGTPSVQVEVQPGETFDYEFVVHDAGTFWYHPHLHSETQIERGLYGPIVVHGGPEIPVNADRTFVLDDVKLMANGELSPDTTQLDVMLGRQGNVVLANGVRNGQLSVRSGARERWRFINAANGRYFRLRLPGHRFRVIAWDGGLLAEPYDAETLLIVPGERYEVLVELREAVGKQLTLQTVYYDRGHDIPDPGPLPVLTITIEGQARELGPVPDVLAPALALDVPPDAVERSIELGEREPEGDGFATFSINDHAYPDVPPIASSVGDVEVWRIYNDSEMDHPFHLHGMFFRVLDVDGEPPLHDGWKDTVNVPRKQVLRFAVRYAAEGTWMYHCHILEHADRGMMGALRLSSADESNP